MIAIIMEKLHSNSVYKEIYIFLENRPQENLNEKVVCILINITFQLSTGLIYTLDTNKQDYVKC